MKSSSETAKLSGDKLGAAASTASPRPGDPPVKSGATGSSTIPPNPAGKASDPPKPEAPAKAGATGSSAIKPDASKAETKSEGPGSSATPGVGPQASSRVGANDSLTDGPILDLKAKRLSDAADAKPADKATAGASQGPTPKVASTPSQPSSGSGFGAVAASGLIGGVIGAGLLFALAQTGVLGSDQARLTDLDQKIAALAPRDALGALDKRIAANEQALKQLPEAVKSASDRASEALQKASAASASPPVAADGAAAPQSPSADLIARLDALDQRVSALQEEPGRDQPADSVVAPSRSGDDATRLSALDERLKALEAKGGATGEANAAGAASTAVPSSSPEIGEKFAALQGDFDAQSKANASADRALTQRLDQLQQSLDARVKSATEAVQSATEASRQVAEAGKAQAEEAAKGIDRRLQEQSERLAALDKAVDGSAKAATVQAALRIVATDRIATALAAGTPYADALASLRNADSSDGSGLQPLAAFADTGAPTAASLAQAFKPISEKIIAERRAAKARSVAETGSIADRLQNMASSIVQVKRTGTNAPAEAGTSAAAPADDDPTAKVQDALQRGQVGEAEQAFAALPEDVRAQAGDFGTKLKARAEAESAVQALQAQAFKSLSAPAAGR